MAVRSDALLRRLTLVMFAGYLALVVVTVVLSRDLTGRPGLTHPDSAAFDIRSEINLTALALVGLLLSWLRPRNLIGWLLALSGLLGAACNAGQAYGMRAVVVPADHLPLGTLALSIFAPLWIPCLLIPATVLLVRYPSGVITGRWDRRFDRAAVAGFVLTWAGYATMSNAVTDEVVGHEPPVHPPEAVSVGIFIAGAVLIVGALASIGVSTMRRMLRATSPERQQIAWLLTTTFPAFVLVFLPNAWLGSIAFVLIPVAIAVGVLRYRLLGIEVVVRRTMLYGILTGLVLLVFVAVTSALATVVPRGPAPEVVAASLIAIGLAPAREWVQRVVDRIVYGDRNEPWTALQRLSAPLGGPAEIDVRPEIVAAVAGALRAPGAGLLAPDASPVVLFGDLSSAAVSVPVRYGGEDLGSLAVTPRRGETGLASPDHRLLNAIAPLVGAVWHAALLADDLHETRSRLVAATECERDRLRRELHDGLGPSLTGIGLGLEALERTAQPRQHELIARLRTEASRSLDEVRRIIEDLRPGALAEHDLLAAVRERVAQVNADSRVQVELRAPVKLDLPLELESAAYRIVDEALVNVIKHSGAGRCAVTIRTDDCLHLSVADDGVGLDGAGLNRARTAPDATGVGVNSMRHRALRLGGTFTMVSRCPGLEVLVRLPMSRR